MFESVVADLINGYLGKYIQNLDSSNLNISVFQGDVELTDLQLKSEALFELNLPIEVKGGFVGKVKISIPWTRLFFSKVLVTVEDVYILAGPITDRPYDPFKEKCLQNACKQQKLELALNPMITAVADSADSDPGFTEKLVSSIINNIQVFIENVHIRYEDTITNVDHPFACGLMLKKLSAESTNSKWQPTYIDNAETVVHKFAQLKNLGVYWNPYLPEQHLVRSRLNSNGWRNLLKNSIDSYSIFKEDFDFILEPLSLETKVIMNNDGGFKIPRIYADFTLDDIEFLLSRQQLLNVLNLSDSFYMMSVNQRYRKYHPNVPIKVSPRSWWWYAYNSVIEERIRPYSWERIKEHRTKYKKYRDMYKKHLAFPKEESYKRRLWELEAELDVANIVLAREHAKLQFIKEAPERTKKKKKKQRGWFSWLLGTKEDEDEEEEFELEAEEKTDWFAELTPKEKDNFYKAIGYDENANILAYPAEYVAYKAQFKLKNCCLSMVKYSKKILEFSLSHFLTSFEYRPAGDALRLACKTESFVIEGASVEHDLVPILTSDIGVYASSVNQVFTFDFETKPLYVDADFSLKLNIQPVEIVYDEHSISEVTAFFQVPNTKVDMRAAAMEALQEVAKYSHAGLLHAIHQHKTCHLAVNMRSPYMVIPEFGTLQRGGNVLVVDFGILVVESELQPKDVSLEDATMSEIESRLYDQFNIKITDIKVLLSDSGDDWHTAQTQGDSSYHILPSTRLSVTFFNSVRPDYKELPQQKLVTNLPTLKMNISDDRLLVLVSFFHNFPMPASMSMATIADDAVDGFPPMVMENSETQIEPDVRSLRKIRKSIVAKHSRDSTGSSVYVDAISSQESATLLESSDDYYTASDHSDEEFTDWTKTYEVKSVDDHSSATNTIRVLLRVMLNEVVLQLSKKIDKKETPYLMFRINKLCLDGALTVFGVVFQASLGGVELVDKIHVSSSGEYLELLSSKSDDNLMSITYRKVEPKCPDFSTYSYVVQGANVKLDTISIFVDQAGIIHLSSYTRRLINSIQEISMKASAASLTSCMEVGDRTSSAFMLKTSLSDEGVFSLINSQRLSSLFTVDSSIPPTSIELSLTLAVKDIHLKLCDTESDLAEIHVKGVECLVNHKSTKSTFYGRLRDLSVKDCSPGAIYPNIILIEDTNLFDVKLIRYRKHRGNFSKSRQRLPIDYTIVLKIGELQAVCLTKFFWDLTRFFEPIVNVEVADEAKAAVVESVNKQVSGIQFHTLHISFTFDIHAPVLLLPRYSKSTELLLVKLGHLDLRNYFETTSVGVHKQPQEWNHLFLNFSSIRISRAELSLADDKIQIAHDILDPVTLKADVRMALTPMTSPVEFDIMGQLNLLKVNLLQKDAQCIIGVLKENYTEGAPSALPAGYHTTTPFHAQHSTESVTPVVESREFAAINRRHQAIVMNVTLDGIVLYLMKEKVTECGREEQGIGQFEMGRVNIEGTIQPDWSSTGALQLHWLLIDDIQPDSKVVVKRVLKSVRNYADDSNKLDHTPILDVTYKSTGEGSHKIDFTLKKMRLNINLPYVMVLMDFVNEVLQSQSQPLKSVSLLPLSTTSFSPDDMASLTVYGKISSPEIVLFADPEKRDSRVLVLQSNVLIEYFGHDSQYSTFANITDLQVVSCVYGQRDQILNKILLPCSVEFSRNYFILEKKIKMSCKLNRFEVYLSVKLMNLLMQVYGMMQISPEPAKSSDRNFDTDNVYRDLWNVQPLSSERWLDTKSDTADASSLIQYQHSPVENFEASIKEMNILFEVENEDFRIPLLCCKTSLEASVSDWSKQLQMHMELHLELAFFNEKQSIWEPLVEPVMEKENVYRPWELMLKIIKARSQPIAWNYEETSMDLQDGLENDVQELLQKNRIKSSSSESETDSTTEMTVIRRKVPRKNKLGNERSFGKLKSKKRTKFSVHMHGFVEDSMSRHSSVQGESDSEPESFIHNITNKLGNIFSSDSSEADVSETDENDEIFDPALDKPIFMTPKGPVHVGLSDFKSIDEVDGITEADDSSPLCTYVVLNSCDTLKLNVTPQAISVLQDVIGALTQPAASLLSSLKELPAFEIFNEVGLQASVMLHQETKLRIKNIHGCTLIKAGEDTESLLSTSEEKNIFDEDEIDGLSFLGKALAIIGSTKSGADALVLSDDHPIGNIMDKDMIRFHIEGFDSLPSLQHKRACHRLVPLMPSQNGTKYCILLDIDMHHGRKMIKISSPLKFENNLTMALDMFCKTQDMKIIPGLADIAQADKEYTKLGRIEAGKSYHVPLLIAYHCSIYICPAELEYQKTYSPIWWQDLIQLKERCKYFMCLSDEGEKRSFNIKVSCKDGEPLKPCQSVPKTIPYYILHFSPPVLLHNYLPYDVQFSLEGTGAFSSLTHGDTTPLYTIGPNRTHKLQFQISDYLGSDWSGSLDISQDMDEFKAILMETEADREASEKHLSLSIHSNHSLSLDLRIYSPYWIINKTELPILFRGSGSDALFECNIISSPLLFRYKKHRRKKAKLQVYESKWSHSFSMDTVGSSGVIICYDKERKRKYQFMMHVQLSKLQLSKIVTIMPYFLVVNHSRRKLRYMEENEQADLWIDLGIGECAAYWPVTDSYNMYVKYEDSNVVSQHFPVKSSHMTVLRMDQGTGLFVEVSGGTETPFTITFYDYSPGDAPAKIENLCDDIFIKIHQKNQSQVTLLSPNQTVLYTWDDPSSERTLMWNVVGGKKPSYPAFITKDGYGDVRLKVQSLCKTADMPDTREVAESSPEDDSDEPDAMMTSMDGSFVGITRSDKVVIYWMSFLDGLQRVLMFTQDERVARAVRQDHIQGIDLPHERGVVKMNQAEQTSLALVMSLDSICASIINSAYEEVALITLTNCPAIWEVEVSNKWKMLNVELQTWLEDRWKNEFSQANLYDQIEADLSKMTMTKPYMGALKRTYHPSLWALYRQSPYHKTIHMKLQRLQIDNQLSDGYFPTVLYPVPVPSYILRKTGPKPFIELGAMRQTIPEKNVDNVRCIKLLIQEFNIKLDKGFILSLYDVFASLEAEEESSQLRSDLLMAQRSLQEVAEVIATRRPHKLFFEYLHLSPLKFHISFSLHGTTHVARVVPSKFTSDIVDFFLSSVGATLTEIKEIELRMAFFERKGMVLSTHQLLSQIQSHYTSQAIQQAYVLVFGLDVLGNPYGLIKDFTQGLGDLFYEPFLGSIQGTDEFAEGLVRGIQSLLGHTVGSAAGSVALVTGSLGNALAALSFDADYKKKRNRRVMQQPSSFPETLAIGAKSFIIGVCLGLSGIILDPVKGAHEDGVEGFFKGIGKGIMGLITKPSGGIIDMFSIAFDGLRRASEMEGGVVARMRLPRFIHPSMGLKPYSPYQAAGLRLLHSIRKGQYLQSDIYWAHASLSKEERSDVFLITDKHLFLLEKSRLWGDWGVEWEVPIESILGIPAIIDNRLVFKVKRDDSSLNLFSSGERDIESKDEQVLQWIRNKIENVLKFRLQ